MQPAERWRERPTPPIAAEPATGSQATAQDRDAAATLSAIAAPERREVAGQAQGHGCDGGAKGPRLLQFVVRSDRAVVRTLMATADPDEMASMTALIGDITDAVRTEDALEGLLYLDITEFGSALPVTSILLDHATALRRRHLSVIG